MRSEALWQISVTTPSEAEEAVAALLEDLFSQPAVIFWEEATRLSRVTVFSPDRSVWNSRKRAALAAGLKRVRACGLAIGTAKTVGKRIRREAWAESWRRHFQPLEIGPQLLIKPSWSRRRLRKNQAVVVLDPGLSFGTGQHPTTAFCLQQLVRCRKPGARQSFLDLGTGSGILAIAAAKLGYSPVHAADNDAQAVRVARANAQRNGVAGRVTIRQRDLTRLPVVSARRYHVICANLTNDLLAAEAKRIVNRLRPDGTLVLAGILASQFSKVRQTFAKGGLRLRSSQIEAGWRSGAFGFAR
ncbi:MAG: 50S ribosomal protein L11 methyltransferase [Limisphaerales bacterium]